MALQVSFWPPSLRSPTMPSWSLGRPALVPDHLRCVGDRSSGMTRGLAKNYDKRKGIRISVRSSLDIAGPVVGQVTEVDKDSFWPLVKAAGDKVVVLDMYTQW
nr:TPA_asm: hypothetical protein HUJ06_007811 [Nelumbo nucifera]